MLFCSDLNAYVKDVNVMMNEGYVTHNYYIEYSPCLLHLIPLNVLKQQIILDGVEKEQLLSSLFQRIRHMETESMVHIFCISGLRQLMEQGRIAGYPDMLYKPLDPAMRLWLLKSYYQYMLHTPHSCICVKENFVQLPKHISIVCSSNVHNGIAFWNNYKSWIAILYFKKNPGFSQKSYMKFLPVSGEWKHGMVTGGDAGYYSKHDFGIWRHLINRASRKIKGSFGTAFLLLSLEEPGEKPLHFLPGGMQQVHFD